LTGLVSRVQRGWLRSPRRVHQISSPIQPRTRRSWSGHLPLRSQDGVLTAQHRGMTRAWLWGRYGPRPDTLPVTAFDPDSHVTPQMHDLGPSSLPSKPCTLVRDRLAFCLASSASACSSAVNSSSSSSMFYASITSPSKSATSLVSSLFFGVEL
jgi:hypothetical protein